MKVVIDTNIVVSAALSPKGKPAKIIGFITDNEEIKVYYSADILAEYEEVLSRSKFNIGNDMKTRTINLIKSEWIIIEPDVSIIQLPDEADRFFYDTAKASGAILITGNLKHYPSEPFIMTPNDFLKLFENED